MTSRYRSPRQRRDAHRRLRRQRELEKRLGPLREILAATRPVTQVDRLAREYGVSAKPWRVREGAGVTAWWPGGRIVGTLEAVRGELERRYCHTA